VAIYTPTLTTSARGKLGGVVFHGTGGKNIMRSRAIPIKPSTAGQLKQQAIVATAPPTWIDYYAQYTFAWQALASWLTYGTGADLGVYVNPNNIWTGALSNCLILGTMPGTSGDDNPDPPAAITSVTLSAEFGEGANIAAFSADGAYASPWLLYLTQLSPPTGFVPPNTGGTCLGGSITGDPFSINEALAVAGGYEPQPGTSYALRAVSLYPNWFATGTSYPFVVTLTE
jgi:hypothetical protein